MIFDIRYIVKRAIKYSFSILGVGVHSLPSKVGKFSSDSDNLLELYYGHSYSRLKKLPLDKNKDEIPWFTYPSIEFIKQFDLSNINVFEWGSGSSSVFFSKRVKSIISVEHDKQWFDLIISGLRENQKLRFEHLSQYSDSIKKEKSKFDIIIIDGVRRFDCAKEAVNFLAENGCIILDNSDWYSYTSSYLRGFGLNQVDFHGFGPINNYTWTTSLFFHSSIGFSVKNNIQPQRSAGSIFHDEIDFIKDEDKKYMTNNYQIVCND